jgi:GNAT superfamily N-acetyltransferase
MHTINVESDWALSTELGEHLNAFSEQQVGPRKTFRFAISARDDEGALVAGLTGETFWNGLYVHILWVHSTQRRNGYGTALMWQAETIARERGCDVSILSTFSFQAPGFYRKLGYEVFGEVGGLPHNHRRLWLSKQLAPS